MAISTIRPSLHSGTASPSEFDERSVMSERAETTCPEWTSILDLYRLAAATYSDGLASLRDPLDPRFNEIWQRTENARKSCDFYRSELLGHEHTHGCGGRVMVGKTA